VFSYGFILLAQIACLIHAGRTGRPYFWFMIILFVPGLGILAYLAVEVIPGLLRGRAAARLSHTVSAGLDPARQYREFARAVEALPSVANLRALADECVRLGRYGEAIDLYKNALTGMHETEPGTLLGLATAEFRKGDVEAGGATLDRLFAANPDFRSPDADLLAARILEASGRVPEALSAYERLSTTYPGEEAKGRWRCCFKGVEPSSGRARSSPRSANQSNARPRSTAGRNGNGTSSRAGMHELGVASTPALSAAP
jgi:hypothetical protein